MDRENKAYKAFAKKVICAAPLQVLRNISFSNISENKRLVFDNQARTSALKIFFVVKKPFWRNKNYSGDGLFSNDWTVNICHDVTPND
jgi:monoamine oxidase